MICLNSRTMHLSPKDDVYRVQRLELYWRLNGIWSNTLMTVTTQIKILHMSMVLLISKITDKKNVWQKCHQESRLVLFLALTKFKGPWMPLNVVHTCMCEYIYIYTCIYIISSLAPVEKQVGCSHQSIHSEVRAQGWPTACCSSDVVRTSVQGMKFTHALQDLMKTEVFTGMVVQST